MDRETYLANLATQTQVVYDRNAARFDAERAKNLFERGWLERFRDLLPTGSHILDAGCGAAEPIAEFFIAQGFSVTGIDFSKSVLEIAASRFPGQGWQLADMRNLALGRTFDGLVAWHSFFHLRPDEQRSTLPRLARHLAPRGALMVTVGHEAGEVTGRVGDDTVYHASLSFEEYRQILDGQDIDIVDFVPEDPSCDGATILLAQKRDT